ncbi:hypothetical protein [Microbispora rosea]
MSDSTPIFGDLTPGQTVIIPLAVPTRLVPEPEPVEVLDHPAPCPDGCGALCVHARVLRTRRTVLVHRRAERPVVPADRRSA